MAYDYFLKGLDLLFKDSQERILESISWFQKAIEQDPEFARAYADIAIAYYRLDILVADKKYSDSINYYADKALLLDSQLPQSLMAKAFYYMNSREYELAIPHLEKALEYNPNSAIVINTLIGFLCQLFPQYRKVP